MTPAEAQHTQDELIGREIRHMSVSLLFWGSVGAVAQGWAAVCHLDTFDASTNSGPRPAHSNQARAANAWLIWAVQERDGRFFAWGGLPDSDSMLVPGELIADTLDELRSMLPAGLTRSNRTAVMSARIVETGTKVQTRRCLRTPCDTSPAIALARIAVRDSAGSDGAAAAASCASAALRYRATASGSR